MMNGTITVDPAAVAPDVSIESVDVTDGAQEAGEDVKVVTVLRNADDGTSGAFTISVFASTDNQITQSDRPAFLRSTTVPSGSISTWRNGVVAKAAFE